MTLVTFFTIKSPHTLPLHLSLYLPLPLPLSNTHTYPSYWVRDRDPSISHAHVLVHNNMDYVYYICHHN